MQAHVPLLLYAKLLDRLGAEYMCVASTPDVPLLSFIVIGAYPALIAVMSVRLAALADSTLTLGVSLQWLCPGILLSCLMNLARLPLGFVQPQPPFFGTASGKVICAPNASMYFTGAERTALATRHEAL
ncbi:hypothetical protein BIW11_03585 [Tropilaelaps mercedesae]|uniref:Uncharacterized protein n=1 Tax=Tropilaelaps mercedesae TaxID=418985 RepID=A0A1V9XIW6_9ACAR|nr:hypothetical protein BIW11_03585 [Tropilaelaps mercedesae]